MCDGRRAKTCTGKPESGGGEREAADDGDPSMPPPATISGPSVIDVCTDPNFYDGAASPTYPKMGDGR